MTILMARAINNRLRTVTKLLLKIGAAITNAAEGQSGSLTVLQDATGGRALTLDASQTDMLGTLADLAGMGANEECEIAWRKTDNTNCKLWITIPA